MKYECEMIRDLMPICADGIASKASEAVIQAHLAECKECAAEWDSIRSGSGIFPETAVSEETKQYAKTAKRVRKKRRTALILTSLLTLLVLVIGWFGYAMGFVGGRFSPEQAVRLGLKRNFRDVSADSIWTLCTEAPQYVTEKVCFMQFPDPESGAETLMAVSAFKAGPLYFCGGILGKLELPAEQGIYAITDRLQFPYYTACYYYVNDPAVKEIRMTNLYGKEEQNYSVQPGQDSGSICAVYPKHLQYRGNDGTITGRACDADGNVIYTLNGNTWEHT